MDGAAPSTDTTEYPEFHWDPSRRRISWANAAGLKAWGEDSLEELTSRWFAPTDATATALSGLATAGSGLLRLPSSSAAPAYQATVRAENGGLRVILNDLETSARLDAPHMSEGFELAPRPLAIFDAAGALITQNEADRLCFGPKALADRLEDAAETSKALGVALVDESFSKIFTLGEDAARWRVNFRRLRGADGEITILAEFSDLPARAPEDGLDRQAVAAIAHDFRAPLTAIRGFADFLASGNAPPERHADYLASIQSAAEGLTALADRFVAMGAEGDAPLHLIDLNKLAEKAAELHEIAAAEAGAEINVTIDPSAAPVLGDPLPATRIIQNLASNALRHSKCAALSISVDGDEITVADDGVGMEQAALDAALTPYGDRGAGSLGLANCVELAAGTGATIEFITAPDAGFRARLSFAP